MLKQVTELMINDFNEVKGTDIHKLDPNNASIEKTTEN